MVTKETNGASLVGYLVDVAWKPLLGKSVVGFRKVCDVHSTAVSFLSVLLQGLRKQEIPVWILLEAGALS